MSTREWDLLSRLVRTEDDSLANACREIALAVGAARLYCIVESAGVRHVHAFDYEGYPVASAEARLQGDLLKTALGSAVRDAVPHVIRRPALDVRGAAAAVALELASGAKLALVLEHRFGGSALAALEDNDLGRWLTLCALAYRLEQRAEAAQRTPPELAAILPPPRAAVAPASPATARIVPAPVAAAVNLPASPGTEPELSRTSADQPELAEDSDSSEEVEGEVGPEQRSQSVSALQTSDWNISRAARQLGMTRHGLKKRMRRLGIRRPHGLAE